MKLLFSEEDSRRIWQMMGNELVAWKRAAEEKQAIRAFTMILLTLALSMLVASYWHFLETATRRLLLHLPLR